MLWSRWLSSFGDPEGDPDRLGGRPVRGLRDEGRTIRPGCKALAPNLPLEAVVVASLLSRLRQPPGALVAQAATAAPVGAVALHAPPTHPLSLRAAVQRDRHARVL